MGDAAFSIQVDGSSRVEAELFALAEANRNLSPLMESLAFYGEISTIERFDTETAPDGSRWTQSIRAREQGGKTLTDQAILKNSITSGSDADTARWGSNLIYAGPHQTGVDKQVSVSQHVRTVYQIFGRKLPGGLSFKVGPFDRHMQLPKREFLGVSAEDETEMLAIVEDYQRDAAPGIER